LFDNFQKFVVFRTIDEKWREHLHSMDQLREGIGLRAYGQKNPLIEYKSEGFRMFANMMEDTNKETLKRIFRTRLDTMGDRQVSHSNAARNVKIRHDESTGMGFIAPPKQTGPNASVPPRQGKRQPIQVEEKIGRNTPCPCGSGKKYKKCHGAYS